MTLKVFFNNEEYYPNRYKNFLISGDNVTFITKEGDKFPVKLSNCRFETAELVQLRAERDKLYDMITHPAVIGACEECGVELDFNGRQLTRNDYSYRETSHNETVVHNYVDGDDGGLIAGLIIGSALF